MSTAEILSLISLISYILAGVCLVLALFFWIFFKIPSVIGDLSGRTAKKSIAKMRQANERSGNKSYRASAANEARGKLTETMQHSSKLNKQPAEKHSAKLTKPKPATQAQQVVPVAPNRPETGLLSDNVAKHAAQQETEMLSVSEETTMLDPDATMPLHMPRPAAARTGGKKLTMINEVMLIHTDEVIV
jgi:hypothetical protein